MLGWEIKIEDTRQEQFGEKLVEWGIKGWQPCTIYNNFYLILKKRQDDK